MLTLESGIMPGIRNCFSLFAVPRVRLRRFWTPPTFCQLDLDPRNLYRRLCRWQSAFWPHPSSTVPEVSVNGAMAVLALSLSILSDEVARTSIAPRRQYNGMILQILSVRRLIRGSHMIVSPAAFRLLRRASGEDRVDLCEVGCSPLRFRSANFLYSLGLPALFTYSLDEPTIFSFWRDQCTTWSEQRLYKLVQYTPSDQSRYEKVFRQGKRLESYTNNQSLLACRDLLRLTITLVVL